MIDLHDIRKEYKDGKNKKIVLNGINIKIEQGDFVVITGESGCGKSTLLNIIGGLEKIDNGQYLFDNKEINNEKDRLMLRRNDISMILQNFALLNNLSVKDNILMAKDDNKCAMDLVIRLGIDDLYDKKVKLLSGGQKQRVAIARALIKKPKVLLADEPTGSLDKQTGEQLIELLKELNEEGLTIIMVTHNLNIVNMIKNKYEIVNGKLIKY